MIPKSIGRQIFWDVDFRKIDPKKNRRFVIERVLEYGNEEAARWLFRQFSKKDIIKVLKSSRRLSGRSQSYWRLMLELWFQKSSKKSSAPKPSAIWKY